MGQFQFAFQGRQHPFPEIFVDAPVGLESRIMDGGHIGFLVRKVLYSVFLKVFYRFLAGKATFFFRMSKAKQLIQNTEQLSMFSVDDFDTYIIPFLPSQIISHMHSSRRDFGTVFSACFYQYIKRVQKMCQNVTLYCVFPVCRFWGRVRSAFLQKSFAWRGNYVLR